MKRVILNEVEMYNVYEKLSLFVNSKLNGYINSFHDAIEIDLKAIGMWKLNKFKIYLNSSQNVDKKTFAAEILHLISDYREERDYYDPEMILYECDERLNTIGNDILERLIDLSVNGIDSEYVNKSIHNFQEKEIRESYENVYMGELAWEDYLKENWDDNPSISRLTNTHECYYGWGGETFKDINVFGDCSISYGADIISEAKKEIEWRLNEIQNSGYLLAMFEKILRITESHIVVDILAALNLYDENGGLWDVESINSAIINQSKSNKNIQENENIQGQNMIQESQIFESTMGKKKIFSKLILCSILLGIIIFAARACGDSGDREVTNDSIWGTFKSSDDSYLVFSKDIEWDELYSGYSYGLSEELWLGRYTFIDTKEHTISFINKNRDDNESYRYTLKGIKLSITNIRTDESIEYEKISDEYLINKAINTGDMKRENVLGSFRCKEAYIDIVKGEEETQVAVFMYDSIGNLLYVNEDVKYSEFSLNKEVNLYKDKKSYSNDNPDEIAIYFASEDVIICKSLLENLYKDIERSKEIEDCIAHRTQDDEIRQNESKIVSIDAKYYTNQNGDYLVYIGPYEICEGVSTETQLIVYKKVEDGSLSNNTFFILYEYNNIVINNNFLNASDRSPLVILTFNNENQSTSCELFIEDIDAYGNTISIDEVLDFEFNLNEYSFSIVDKENDEKIQQFVFPNSDKEYLVESDLYSLDAFNLKIARNEIYARRGLKFKSEELQEYFGQFDWYEARWTIDEFDENIFNEYEKANLILISEYEKRN